MTYIAKGSRRLLKHRTAAYLPDTVIGLYLRHTVWVNCYISPISEATLPPFASLVARSVGEGIGPQCCAILVQSAVQLTACGKGQETVTVTAAGVSGEV